MPFRPKNSRFWHYDFQIRGRRFHGSCGTEDFEQAKAIEAEARVKAKTGRAERTTFTLSEALGTYWSDISQHQSSSRTTLGMAKTLISEMPPGVYLDELTNANILTFTARRRATVSNATVNRQLELLGRAMRHMAKFYNAEIADLDLRSASLKESPERVRELTADEQARLFEHLRPDLHPMVKFALMTGARKASITGLKWSAIDLDTGRIRFALKGGREMFFPINNEMRAFLTSLPRANTPLARAYVFTFVDKLTAERKPLARNGGSIDKDWRDSLAAAEIDNFRFHDCRHTFATRLLRQTGNLKLVSRLLGHTNVQTTTRYAHVMDGDLRDALADFSISPAPQSRRKSRNV